MDVEAVRLFFGTSELVEEVFLMLDLKSALNLAHVLDKEVLKKGLSFKVWTRLVKFGCPRNNRKFKWHDWNGVLTRRMQDMVEKVQRFVAILKLIEKPRVFQVSLLNTICARFPSKSEWMGEIEVMNQDENVPCQKVSRFGFLLLEEVEGALETAEHSIVAMRIFLLTGPLLSAVGSRMVRQFSTVTSAGVYIAEIHDKKSAQGFHQLMQVPQDRIIDLRVQGMIGTEGWELVAEAIKLQPEAVRLVVTSKEVLIGVGRVVIRDIWNSLGISEETFIFYIYKTAKTRVLSFNCVKVSKWRNGWAELERILNMSEEQFGAELAMHGVEDDEVSEEDEGDDEEDDDDENEEDDDDEVDVQGEEDQEEGDESGEEDRT